LRRAFQLKWDYLKRCRDELYIQTLERLGIPPAAATVAKFNVSQEHKDRSQADVMTAVESEFAALSVTNDDDDDDDNDDDVL
jgi:hypothetical protein